MLMQKLHASACTLMFLLVAFLSHAQSRIVTGTVTDSRDGTPVAGVTVTVKNSSQATQTNESGFYSLNVPSSGATLVFTYVGFETAELPVDGEVLNASLNSSTTDLDNVVVIGYGTAQRKDVTGAVASVSNKDFSSGVITNPMQQVAGKVPGLVITQPSGDPNQTMSIRLRGQTSLTGNQSPLIVVDGTPLSDPNQIANINPNDIASYDVLKDASATAIYGSRGANGVIIINTKKGRSGRGTVEYNGYVGFDKNAKKYDFLGAKEYIDNGGPDKGGNTDWVDAITQTGRTHSHNVAIAGGTRGGFNYRGGVTYMNQKGIIINTGREMYALNFNGQQKAIDDKLDIKLGVNSTFTNRKYADYGIFYFVQNIPPTEPVYLPDGRYNPYVDFDVFNPLQRQYLQLNKGNERLNQLSGSVDYELLRGLKVGAAGSLSYFTKQTDFFKPTLSGENNVNNGNRYLENDNMMRGDFHINYSKIFGLHSVSATGVYENNYFSFDNFRAAGENYLNEDNLNNDLGSGNPAANQIGSYKRAHKLISFLGRVVYNYDSKYYLTASLRRDGSSKFGKNSQWGYFPSVSAAWRLTNEPFIKNFSWINDLKVSIGFGLTGNSDAIEPYRNLLLLGSTNTYYNPATPNFAYRRAYSPIQNANPDLKWETRQGLNLGLDFALFNRLRGNLNIFNDKTKDLLYNYTVPVPPFFVNNIFANVGDLSNKGVELQLDADVVNTGRFQYNLGGQISFVKTKVEKLSGTYAGFEVATDDIIAGSAQGRGLSNSPITYLKVGYSPYTFFLPHYVGLNAEGKQLFDDGKGGTVTSTELNNDMKRYIDPAPKFTYGINNNLTYGQWNLNFFLRGVGGQKLFSNTRMNIDNISGLQGRNTTASGVASGNKDIKVPSDLWLLDASFLRMDNATLSYTFKKISSYISNMRLYVTGNNLFVITKYRGLDPEIQVASTNNAYIDFNTGENGYYKSRGVVLGVNVTF